jgi:hypothetical protein
MNQRGRGAGVMTEKKSQHLVTGTIEDHVRHSALVKRTLKDDPIG